MLISSITTDALRSLVSAMDQDAENEGMCALPSFGNVGIDYLTANSEATREELLEALSNSCDTTLSEKSEMEEVTALLGESALTHIIDATNSQFDFPDSYPDI